MYTIKRIEIKFPKNYLEIEQHQKPKGLELLIVEDEFLNASGSLFEITVNFILEQVVSGILIKLGSDSYNYLRELILKNNENKKRNSFSLRIKIDDFSLKFNANNLNDKNINNALEAFEKILEAFEKIPLKSDSNELVYDENQNQWKSIQINTQKSIEDLQNEAMNKFND